MKNSFKIIVTIFLLTIISLFIYQTKYPLSSKDSLVGCYVANLEKDVYGVNILSQEGQTVKGFLSFKNFEKDSSSGDFEGVYRNGILSGTYSFQSEGATSILEVAFKKTEEGLIRGFGEMSEEGDHFANINKIEYSTSTVFKPSRLGCEKPDNQ